MLGYFSKLYMLLFFVSENNKKAFKTALFSGFKGFGGRGWIRTTEVIDDRFTVCSLWPLGNSSILYGR